MKNIHVIPTDKPSRLHFDHTGLFLSKNHQLSAEINSIVKGQNIYITSDEEIKEGDWCHTIGTSLFNEQIGKVTKQVIADNSKYGVVFKKIILTTDQDLIKDGVQAIDDEFLEWFVKNLSCEEVEVQRGFLVMGGWVKSDETAPKNLIKHKIIIPKEEPKQENCCTSLGQIKRYIDCKGCDKKPKQETLEEFIKRESKSANESVGIVKGAKWQQENSYSEEDLEVAFFEGQFGKYSFNDWFEQFKKK